MSGSGRLAAANGPGGAASTQAAAEPGDPGDGRYRVDRGFVLGWLVAVAATLAVVSPRPGDALLNISAQNGKHSRPAVLARCLPVVVLPGAVSAQWQAAAAGQGNCPA